eukprot:652339-Alexandrium_andersonii.AAC.1
MCIRDSPFTVAVIGGVFYHFRVLVFGAASAPTVWGRFAAWLGRSIAVLADPRFLRAEIYVGDPLLVVGGPRASR